MDSSTPAALARIAIVALISLGIWVLARYCTKEPVVLPASAPANVFSAGRAETVLTRVLGPERPHPASTAENAAVRERILREYASLGVPATTYRGLGCHMNKNYADLVCATVTDVIANVKAGSGKAIMLLSHLDSVPAGPGASDDESGVATTLETVRALKSDPDGMHPIIAVNTDGEEFGLLGAASFLDSEALKSRVGAVVNVEARGTSGPSQLFQTSPGDGPLVDLYATSVPTYSTGSLFAVVYKFLPNDTDLTLFIEDGFLSFNFAFIGDVSHYHTALDRRENLSPVTLQMHGENLLGMARGLEKVDFASLKGSDDVYISILGRWLPRMPASWALALSILALLALIATAWIGREATTPGQWVRAFFILPAFVIGAAALGWVLHEIASVVSGEPAPAYAYPATLRLALALGVLGLALVVARFADARPSTIAIWVWYGLLAVLSAALLPGLSPYFLFPALVAALVLLAHAFMPGAWRGVVGDTAVLLAALVPLLIWLSLCSTGELVGGLAVHPLFTVPAAFGLVTVVPLMRISAMSRGAWRTASGAVIALALVVSAVAGMRPAYSAADPLRLDFNYVEDYTKHRAFWAAGPYVPMPPSVPPLPAAVRAAMNFSVKPERAYPFAFFPVYTAPAGNLRIDPPTAIVTELGTANGARRVAIHLHGTNNANQMVVMVPKAAKLKAIEMEGKRFVTPASWAERDQALIGCFSDDCRDRTITLEIATHASVDVTIGQQTYGLPPDGAKLVSSRPTSAVQSQNGDTTVLINRVTIPGA